MNKTNGFTLIEVVMAAAILVCGLVAVASVFSYSVRTNRTNRQVAVAVTLLYDKMEQIRSAPSTDVVWSSASGLETLVVDGEPYTRSWQIGSSIPRAVTVAVYAERSMFTRRRIQLIQATTLVSPTF